MDMLFETKEYDGLYLVIDIDSSMHSCLICISIEVRQFGSLCMRNTVFISVKMEK